MEPLADDSLADRLRALHEHYVDAVNRAVAADRDDLVAELIADYPDEALALIAPCPAESRPVPPPRMSPTGRAPGIGDRPRMTTWRGRVARWVAALRAAIS
jgi:hypothetical protein